MHLSVIFRILPLLVMGTTQVISADVGLSMKQVGRSGIAKRDSVGAEDYEQCLSICGNQFGPDAQGLAAGSPLQNLVTASTGTETEPQATSTQTQQSKPSKSACRRKQKKHTKRPTSPAQTASTTGTVETVQPSITSSSIVPSSSTVAQSASAVISSTAPEITQSPPTNGGNGSNGVGGPDRSKPEDWLKAHNDERAKYGAEPIIWNEEMASVAQAWGAQCKWAHSQGVYGENIAASIAADTDPVRTATGLWIGESKDYDYENPIGAHWTQMVWKGLGEIGCAAVDCPAETAEDKKTIWTLMVCEYQLKPGAAGSFQENVGRPVA